MVKILTKIRVKKRDPSNTQKAPRKTSSIDTDDDEHSVTHPGGKSKKMNRQDKLAAQKLAKERERTARAAAALDEKGNQLFERGHFDKAMVCYSKALKMKRRTFNNLLEDAEDFDENSTKKLSKSDSQVLVSMATSINNIGYLRQRSGEASAAETMAAYQKSLRIKRRILGNDSLSVGKTLNNIGSVYYLIRDFDGALASYSEAKGIMIQNLGDQHPDIATVMSNMGDVHLANGKEENSLEHYRAALNIRYANFGKHDPRVVRLLEKIAKIEIGDMMIPQDDQSMMDKDWEDRELTELGMKPLQAEYQILNGELKADIEYLDELQQRVSVNMVEENVGIIKSMQDPPSISSFDEEGEASSDVDINSIDDSHRIVQEAAAPPLSDASAPLSPGVCHKEALKHVNYRLEKIRSLKSSKENCFEDDAVAIAAEEDTITRRDTMSTTGSNELYSHYYGQYPQQQQQQLQQQQLQQEDRSVCSVNSDETFGQFYAKSSLRPMDPNAAASRSIRQSAKLSDRSNRRRVIVTS